MRNKLKRYYGAGDFHFITFSCYRRQQLLSLPSSRNLLVRILGEVRDQYVFLLVGYVVMPDHMHLLMSEPPHSNPSQALQTIKQRFSREFRHDERNVRHRNGLPPTAAQVWQRRFYDFNVWNPEKRIEKLEYMHWNPVKRGLVNAQVIGLGAAMAIIKDSPMAWCGSIRCLDSCL